MQIACACPNAASSIQRCNQDGTFDECQCTDAGSQLDAFDAPVDASPGDSADAGSSFDLQDPSKCLIGGNVTYFEGDSLDYIDPGIHYIKVGKYTVKQSPNDDLVDIYLIPSGQQYGIWWTMDFSSRQLSKPLALGTYDDAERYPFETYLKPGLNVSGDGRGCNDLSGKFIIHDISWTGPVLDRITVTFEQHCEMASPALRGCVHYDKNN